MIYDRRKGEGIHIVRILHERRDIEKAFPRRRPR
jgi:plasmid stabilization system protein ParE